MPPSKPGDTFMVPIVIGEQAAAAVKRLAILQEREPDSKELPSPSRMRPDLRRLWNPMPVRRYLINKEGWKPLVGGFSFLLPGGMRAAAVITDANMGRVILEQEATRRRGALVLQEVEGVWYAHIRYRDWHGNRGRDTRPVTKRKEASAAQGKRRIRAFRMPT